MRKKPGKTGPLDSTKPRVLLVDDDISLLNSMHRALHRKYDLVCEPDPSKGLATIEQGGGFSAIVSDLYMAPMNGIDFLRKARDMAPALPRLLLSGNHSLSSAVEAVNRAGVHKVLFKPIRLEEFSAALDEAIALYCNNRYGGPFADSRKRMQTLVANALNTNRMEVHYQPRFCLLTGNTTAVEALARFNGMPDGMTTHELIDAIDGTELMVRLTDAVVNFVGKDFDRLLLAFGQRVHVSINISPSLLLDSAFPDHVREKCARFGIEPEKIELEITEGGSEFVNGEIDETVAALKLLGFRIAIDDFGKGNNSLAALRRKIADVIKVDKSLIHSIANNPLDQQLAGTVVSIARECGMTTVAEGVENQEDMAVVRSLAFDQVQGFFMARPRPVN